GCYQADMFAGVTRWNCTAYNWKRIPRLVQRGLREALSGERGPVHMDIPVDTFFAFQPVTKARFRRLAAAPGSSRFSGSFLPGGEALKEALSLLETAEKPIIAAGLSVLREGAWNALSALADSLPAPVGVTSAALTALTQDHPSYIGVLGHPALDNIPEAVKKADLLITVGTTIGEGEEIMEMVDRRRTRVIQTSPEPELLGALGPVEGALVGDASSICTVLQKCTAGKAAERNKWLKACRKTCDDTLKNLRDKTSENRAGAAVKALSEVMSPEDLVVFDGRESSYWGPLLCRTKSNNSQFQSRGLKGNGYGLPMAMGVKLAHPKRRMIALCDSSALIQHIQELNTSLREGIAVTICAVGEPMDWSKVAEGFGTNSVEAHSHGELAEALRKGNVSESIIINLTGY
ncbi:MAG: thiamine pyrophosphate-binding protein, partial [Actinobacteria bacterium]|nr:thiamine pyrophosphate-binding protein [Actinomycetota bacterium]